MIKWLKRKIEKHNEYCEDCYHWEDSWEFNEWIIGAILSLIIPIGLGIFLTLTQNHWAYLLAGFIIAILLVGFLCWDIDLFTSANLKYTPYINDNTTFIWGIKSWKDLSDNEANLYTMNDLELTYDSDTDMYSLGIETIHKFEHGKIGELEYLKDLLKSFTEFMNENNYNINDPYFFAENQSKISLTAKTIPELYTQFRIFVEGYNVVYGGITDETILSS